MSTDDCPGAGRCHGALSWCASCGSVRNGPCDDRAAGRRCDQHPPAHELRASYYPAQREADDALHAMREAEDGLAFAARALRRAREAEEEARRRLDLRRSVAGRLAEEAARLREALAGADAEPAPRSEARP
jgi:hypothetical protein